MSNNEAKFLLGAYRANGSDADNAVFGDALRQTRSDPALGEWFARAQAHDAAIAGKLREMAPPAGLREAILAGARASRAPRKRWATPVSWLALAAGLAIVATTTTLLLRPNRAAAEAARFAAFAVDDTAHARHGSHGAAANALAVMLAQPSTRLGGALPLDFSTLRATGCRTLNFAGHDVLEVCFNRNGEWFHCYIAQRSDFPGLTEKAGAVLGQEAKFASASWSDSAYHFVVVSAAGVDAVRQLL